MSVPCSKAAARGPPVLLLSLGGRQRQDPLRQLPRLVFADLRLCRHGHGSSGPPAACADLARQVLDHGIALARIALGPAAQRRADPLAIHLVTSPTCPALRPPKAAGHTHGTRPAPP